MLSFLWHYLLPFYSQHLQNALMYYTGGLVVYGFIGSVESIAVINRLAFWEWKSNFDMMAWWRLLASGDASFSGSVIASKSFQLQPRGMPPCDILLSMTGQSVGVM